MVNKDKEIQKILEKLSDEILIPNWFFKHHIEEITGKKISNKKFKEFIEWVKESSIPDEISAYIRVWYSDFEEEMKNA